jgi:hypothetical protein
MAVNFKYYKSGSLIILILVLSVIYAALKEAIAPMIHFPESMHKTLSALDVYLGWVSPVAFIAVVLATINGYLWKFSWMKWLIELPNLNGRYIGELVSSFVGEDGQPVKKDCVIEINQNGSGIHVCSYYADKGSQAQTSMAYSIAEEIVKEKNGSFSLYYMFTNEPDSMLEALSKHNGTAKLTYFADKKQLVGEYYNHRLNKGIMTLTFEDKKCLHRFAK